MPDETRILPGHVSVSEGGRYEVGAPGDPIEARLGTLRDELALLGLNEDESEATELELGPNNCAA